MIPEKFRSDGACQYPIATWPLSFFRLHRMCALHKTWGRITLFDREITVHRNGHSVKRNLPPGRPYLEAIEEHFGIRLNAAYEDFAPLSSAEDEAI